MEADINITEATGTQPEADERPLTAFSALLGVIIRPRATFRKMREARRGHWWVVLALTVVTLVLLTTVTGTIRAQQFAEFQAQREAALAESGESNAAPSGGFQGNAPGGGGGPGGGGPGGGGPGGFRGGAAANPTGFLLRQVSGGAGGGGAAGPTTGTTGTTISVGLGTVNTLFGYLLRGALVLVIGLLLGGRASFRQVFRMGVWTTLPFVVRDIVQLVAIGATGNIPTSGLAGIAFSSGEVSRAMVTILSGIDIYLLWSLILLGVGVAATTQLSRIKSAVVALGYWLVTVAASVGWTALLPTLFGFGG